MKYIYFSFLLFFILTNSAFSVYTKYINDLKFENIEYFEFSNLSFIENSGIELARENKEIFKYPSPLWAFIEWKDGFLVGTGETAQLLYVDEKNHQIVFTASNQILISDIKKRGDSLYVAALPKSKIHILDSKFKLTKTIDLNSEYIWNIVPEKKGYFALCGNPATIYYLNEQDKVEYSIPVTNEDNILKGILIDQALYFIAESSILYTLDIQKKRIRAVTSLDNPITDFILVGKKLYLITSQPESRKIPQKESSESSASDDDIITPIKQIGNKKGTRSGGGRSALYSYDFNGTIEKLYEKSNIRFLTLSYFKLNKAIVIGTDKPGAYFEISENNAKRFSCLGNGRLGRLISSDKNIYAILNEPSRIIKIGTGFSKYGYFISSPFDTGTISRWGKPVYSISSTSKATLRLFSRSGALYGDELWEDWLEISDSIQSSPNRFIQYKVELYSDGKESPFFRNIIIPYVQFNSPPRINKVSITFGSQNTYKINWDAEDDDRDTLTYNIYLNLPDGSYLKLNEKPLEENSFDIICNNYPEGQYRLKIVASDEKSNSKDDAKDTYIMSDPFIVDNTPPTIAELKLQKGKENSYKIQGKVSDNLSPIIDISYSVNGLKWIKILPVDGIYDSLDESFSVEFETKPPATVQIRTMDMYGNTSVKGVILK